MNQIRQVTCHKSSSNIKWFIFIIQGLCNLYNDVVVVTTDFIIGNYIKTDLFLLFIQTNKTNSVVIGALS